MRYPALAGLLPLVLFSIVWADQSTSQPATLYWESAQIAAKKQQAQDPNRDLQKLLTAIKEEAEEALEQGPYSVTFKEEVPPSGDKHDYMSFSRYWWPNPATESGLPYVRRDGHVNRNSISRGDRLRLSALLEDVEILALGYYFLDEENYASHAGKLIRTWFLDPETKMNPHLDYGQAVPGRSEGRGVGIIDTRGFIKLLDSLALLESSNTLQASEQEQLRQWFSDYLDWLRTSELGRQEAEAENNHGSWYAAQVARVALFVGNEELAKEVVEEVKSKRIPSQFTPEGKQEDELRRTQSFHYSLFNLEALSVVARVGEALQIDLWHADRQGRSLQPGLDFLMPYLLEKEQWQYPQMRDLSLSSGSIALLRMASTRYSDSTYLAPIELHPHRGGDAKFAELLFAAATENPDNEQHHHGKSDGYQGEYGTARNLDGSE